jgi:hypothetical protein
MIPKNTTIVVTTIQPPTECMRTLAGYALEHGLNFVVIGDRKGPFEFPLAPAELVTIDEQRELPFKLAKLLPEKHYARKNLGYLLAMSRGCERIYETDDDNAPIEGWRVRDRITEARRVEAMTAAHWVNIYEAYTVEHIWPRGFPLSETRRHFADEFAIAEKSIRVAAPIQQGLANGSPDVDAVWRLVLDRDVTFDEVPNLLLPRGVWCPFNSQNTWWWKEAFPLLYLPSYCSFRMTDIWRSFVAQRCLWELGYELEFHHADVHQQRNEHNLMRDFDDETVGYLRNDDIRQILESCSLLPGASNLKGNIFRCYEALSRENIVGPGELALVEAWLDDCG